MSEPLKLFVNYRRADEALFVQLLRTHFMYRYGRENVFMDFDTIPDFALFEDFIRKKVRECDALVAVIGPQWLKLMQEKEAAGEPDYVLIEIEEALKNGKVVAPICILHADIPSMDDIPENLRVIFDRNVGRLDDGRQLIDNIGSVMNSIEGALKEQGIRREIPNADIDLESFKSCTVRTALERSGAAYKKRKYPEALVWIHLVRESGAIKTESPELDNYEASVYAALEQLEEKGRRQAAAMFHYKLVRELAKSSDNAEVIHAALQEVWKFKDRYDPFRILDLVEALRAIETEPQNPDSLKHSGNLFIRHERYKDALAAYETAIELDPQDGECYSKLGRVYFNLKRYEEALSAYETAFERDPNYRHYYRDSAAVYTKLKRYEDAISAYQEHIKLIPFDKYAPVSLAIMYHRQKRYDEASDILEKAIEIDPRDKDTYFWLGISKRLAGWFEEALEVDLKYVELSTPDSSSQNWLGVLYSILGRDDEAINAFQYAAELDPHDSISCGGLGLVYHRLGQYDDAIEVLHKAIGLKPDVGLPYLRMAVIERERGNQDNFDTYLAKAHELATEDNHYLLAGLACVAEDGDTVLDHLKQVDFKPTLGRARTDPLFDFIRDDPRFRELVGLDPIE